MSEAGKTQSDPGSSCKCHQGIVMGMHQKATRVSLKVLKQQWPDVATSGLKKGMKMLWTGWLLPKLIY